MSQTRHDVESLLVDSSFLYSLYAARDRRHAAAAAYIPQLDGYRFLVPEVTLPEVAFLFRREWGEAAVRVFLKEFAAAQNELVHLVHIDIHRAYEVMAAYPEARLDLVDCCIVALAERLNITRICTFDQRDFGIIRPAHADFLDIAP
jgi:uncharacterized protein